MSVTAIGDLVDKAKTWDPRKNAPDELIRYIDIGSVSQDSKSIGDVTPILGSEAPSRARQLVAAGDILVSTVRPNLNAVARVPDELDGATASTGFSVLRADTDLVDPSYLFHWVRSEAFVADMMRQATGQSYPAVSDKIVKSSTVPLPPLEEQKRIAGILDQAAELCRLRTRALDKLNTLGQAIFHEMFGGSSADLREISVGEALDQGLLLGIQDGNHGERHPKVADFSGEGTPFIMANCLSDGKLDVASSYKLSDHWLGYLRKGFARRRDVLLSHKGTLGEVAIVPEEHETVILSPQVTYYRCGPDLAPEYLKLYFLTRFFQAALMKNGGQSTRAYVGLTRQKNLPLIIPDLSRQRELVQRIENLGPLQSHYECSAARNQALFASLQHRAFRGEL